MFNNEEKRFCLGSSDLMYFLMKDADKDLVDAFNNSGMFEEELLHLVRNGKYDANEDGTDEILEDKLSGFLRREFGYLRGYANCCVERRFKELLEMGANGWDMWILRHWDRWFAPDEDVSNGIYETYDFEKSGRVILHIIKSLNLPPRQAEYVEYYLKMEREYLFSDQEEEILKLASINLLNQGGDIYSRLNELFSIK